jgi:hypothetical protein
MEEHIKNLQTGVILNLGFGATIHRPLKCSLRFTRKWVAGRKKRVAWKTRALTGDTRIPSKKPPGAADELHAMLELDNLYSLQVAHPRSICPPLMKPLSIGTNSANSVASSVTYPSPSRRSRHREFELQTLPRLAHALTRRGFCKRRWWLRCRLRQGMSLQDDLGAGGLWRQKVILLDGARCFGYPFDEGLCAYMLSSNELQFPLWRS